MRQPSRREPTGDFDIQEWREFRVGFTRGDLETNNQAIRTGDTAQDHDHATRIRVLCKLTCS